MAYTTIDDPEAYFQVQLYTGDGSADHAITLGADTDMQPDFVWIKNRDAGDDHCLFDSVRGATEVLHANTTAAEATDADTLDSFTSDGFQVDADVKVNTNAEKYVAWCWKESATAGFDIVAYTGNGTDDTDISHSLSAVPHVILVKNRAATQPWRMQHKALGETYGMILNDTSARDDDDTAWSDEAPTSSVFTLGTSANTNNNTEAFIAYCFSEKQGFSKFGKYTSNDNIDGPFIFLGFKPAFVMIKQYDAAGNNWHIYDNKREGYNGGNDYLEPNNTTAEQSDVHLDILSNGFKIRTTGNDLNEGSYNYIYMAFAEAPFVNSNGVPNNDR